MASNWRSYILLQKGQGEIVVSSQERTLWFANGKILATKIRMILCCLLQASVGADTLWWNILIPLQSTTSEFIQPELRMAYELDCDNKCCSLKIDFHNVSMSFKVGKYLEHLVDRIVLWAGFIMLTYYSPWIFWLHTILKFYNGSILPEHY